MLGRSFLRSSLWLAVGFAMSGCSWVFMDKAPPEGAWALVPPQQYVDCTENKVAPLLDGLVALVHGANGVSSYVEDEPRHVWIGAALSAGIATWAAIDGTMNADNCRRFRQHQRMRLMHLHRGAPTTTPPALVPMPPP